MQRKEREDFAGAELSALEVLVFLTHQLNAAKIYRDLKIIVLNLARVSS